MEWINSPPFFSFFFSQFFSAVSAISAVNFLFSSLPNNDRSES
jgi:hypothetical protein